MDGMMIFVGLLFLVINGLWLFFHYYEECSVSISSCVVNIIVLIWGILLFAFADNGWKDFGLISLLNSASYFVSLIIAVITDYLGFYDYDETHTGLFCTIYGIVLGIIFIFSVIVPSSNIVSLETPTVEEKYYELLSGTSIKENDDNAADLLFLFHSDKGNSYMFYYAMENEDGEIIAVPYNVDEKDVELVIVPNSLETLDSDYLLETVTTYYKEDRNKEPAEKIVDSTQKECKLYLREKTLENMIVVSNGSGEQG